MRSKAVALFAAFLLGLMGLWLIALQVLPRPVESRWIDGIYAKKEAVAAGIAGPKVVIIGGSGTHYSYSARVVSEATGLKAVNLGTHAGLGAEYILHRARASLKPGDTAVIALEHQLVHRTKPSSVLAAFVLTSDPGYLLCGAPVSQVLSLVFGYPPVEVVRQAAARSVPHRSPLYRPETVDAWGDETANSPANKLPYMAATVRSLPAVAVKAPDPGSPPEFLVEFADWAKQNKVRLLQAWPATTFRPVYLTPHYGAYFGQFAETYRRLGFTVLGNPTDYLIPESEMLDSMYHADVVGAERISEAFAVDLCRAIACPGAQPGSAVPKP
jgi:hypothetical protein